MRSMLIVLLLLCNVIYLGMEVHKERKMQAKNDRIPAIRVPSDALELVLVAEVTQPDNIAKTGREKNTQEDTDKAATISTATKAEQSTDTSTDAVILEDMGTVKKSELDGNNPDTANTTAAITSKDESICFRYGPIGTEKEQKTLSNWFNKSNIKTDLLTTNTQTRSLFMVLLDAENSELLQQKYQQLRQKNISDMRILRDIPTASVSNGISLGVFSSKKSAQRRIQQIQSLGFVPEMVPYLRDGSLQYWVDIMLTRSTVDTLQETVPSRFASRPVNCEL